MGMRAEELCAFDTDCAIAKRSALGGAGDDADVKGHAGRHLGLMLVKLRARSIGLQSAATCPAPLIVACLSVTLAGIRDVGRTSRPSRRSRVKKSGEEIPQTLPCFKTDARDLRWGRDALGNDRIVAIAPEGLETERVDFGAAEPESRYDM
jgi:hypothetical protein